MSATSEATWKSYPIVFIYSDKFIQTDTPNAFSHVWRRNMIYFSCEKIFCKLLPRPSRLHPQIESVRTVLLIGPRANTANEWLVDAWIAYNGWIHFEKKERQAIKTIVEKRKMENEWFVDDGQIVQTLFVLFIWIGYRYREWVDLKFWPSLSNIEKKVREGLLISQNRKRVTNFFEWN